VTRVRVYGVPRADGAVWDEVVSLVDGQVRVADPVVIVERVG